MYVVPRFRVAALKELVSSASAALQAALRNQQIGQ